LPGNGGYVPVRARCRHELVVRAGGQRARDERGAQNGERGAAGRKIERSMMIPRRRRVVLCYLRDFSEETDITADVRSNDSRKP
jgi:hypothetical protein